MGDSVQVAPIAQGGNFPGFHTAFVLGAGLGTRLRPLTAHCPKPLVPVRNKPLIAYAFDQVIAAGARQIVVNTHHCPEMYGRVFPGGHYRDVPLVFRNEPDLLETAGGIRNVQDLLGDQPFLVYNGDTLTTMPIEEAVAAHHARGNEVTLVLRANGAREVDLDLNSGRITDYGNRLRPDCLGPYLFTGVYVVNPEFIRRIPPATKLSVVPIFLEMIRSGAPLGGIVLDKGDWWELGNRTKYLEMHRILHEREPGPWIDPSASVSPDAQITGASAIGPGARVESGAVVRDSLLWPGSCLKAGSEIERCVLTRDAIVKGSHSDCDF